MPPPVADEGNDGAGRNTEQCEALQASSATMFMTDSGSAKRIFFISLSAGIDLQFNIQSGCGAAGSARGLGPRGPEFETLHSDQNTEIRTLSLNQEMVRIFSVFHIVKFSLYEDKSHQQTACKSGNMFPCSCFAHKHSADCINSKNYKSKKG